MLRHFIRLSRFFTHSLTLITDSYDVLLLKQVVDEVTDAEMNKPYSLVLLDIQLPE